jgi:hypothetical protein
LVAPLKGRVWRYRIYTEALAGRSALNWAVGNTVVMLSRLSLRFKDSEDSVPIRYPTSIHYREGV